MNARLARAAANVGASVAGFGALAAYSWARGGRSSAAGVVVVGVLAAAVVSPLVVSATPRRLVLGVVVACAAGAAGMAVWGHGMLVAGLAGVAYCLAVCAVAAWDLLADERAAGGVCPRCGYDLSGTAEMRCQECGWMRE